MSKDLNGPNRPLIGNPFSLLRRIARDTGIGQQKVNEERTVTEGLDDGRPNGETWLATDLYCPHCGQQPVHVEAGIGDYYVGSVHWCCQCKTQFYLP